MIAHHRLIDNILFSSVGNVRTFVRVVVKLSLFSWIVVCRYRLYTVRLELGILGKGCTMDTATGWTHRFNPSVVQANGRPFQLRAYKRSVRHVTQFYSVLYSADTNCCMCCCCILHSCVQLARVICTCACVRVRDKLVHNWECKITF